MSIILPDSFRIRTLPSGWLIDDVEKAITDRLPAAESFAPYSCTIQHPFPYYYIQVRNYLIFYVVIGDVMEVRRIVYSRRDMTKQL